MYSNLYKSGYVVVNREEARMIDNNKLMEEKISASLRRVGVPEEAQMYDGEDFCGGLVAEEVAMDALFDPDGAGAVIKAPADGEIEALYAEIEAAKQELAELQQQAEIMMEQAKSEIGAMQMKAYEEAKNQGYLEGERIGKAEYESAKAEYINKKNELETYYRQKVEELEPEFIDTLTGIYEHIFKVDLSRYRDLIISLFETTIQKIEGSGSLLLHVSKADYENVLMGKERLRAETGSMALEIVEDMTLSPTQCYIETDNGIYDCSLDTELAELSRKLKLLSYAK